MLLTHYEDAARRNILPLADGASRERIRAVYLLHSRP